MKATKAQRNARNRARREQEPVKAGTIVHPNAAGIDIAVSSELWVAVGEHADKRPVRGFSPLTGGIRKLCLWLKECQVDTVAMEATGIYWLNLYLELRQAGFEVVVVNPRCVKSLKRKSDISDCQWLRYLHSVGLLRGSFVPPEEILTLRALSRHRENLIKAAAEHTQRMQKALDEMNLHIHHIITDITGTTGCAIIEAILGGERDPQKLAALRNANIKASAQQMAASLEGNWREELLFVLGQEYESWKHLRRQMAECDQQLLARSAQVPQRLDEEQMARIQELETQKASGARRRRSSWSKNQLPDAEQWRQRLHRLLGVDLTLTPGVHLLAVLCLVCELGTNWKCFPTAADFASWLGLCPENRTSSRKVISRATRTVQNRVRNLLKMCAQTLASSKSPLGDQYRRMRARMGPAKANTAMAHKLARILWHQVVHQSPYDESLLVKLDAARQARTVKNLKNNAARLGYELVPLKNAA